MEKIERKVLEHEISSQQDLDFLVQWIKVAFQLHPNLQGEINRTSTLLTGKFVGLDNSGILQICKVEKNF